MRSGAIPILPPDSADDLTLLGITSSNRWRRAVPERNARPRAWAFWGSTQKKKAFPSPLTTDNGIDNFFWD
jgi:hypothetical protein